jgi:PKD repeat protein
MKTINKTLTGLFLFLTIAILTAGTVSALTPIYHIHAIKYSEYNYHFTVENVYNTSITNGDSYSWDLGDGTYSTAPSPYHTYTSSGQKIVTVDFHTPLGQQHLSTNVYPGV